MEGSMKTYVLERETPLPLRNVNMQRKILVAPSKRWEGRSAHDVC